MAFLLLILLFPLLAILLLFCSIDTKSFGLFFQKRVGYKKNHFFIVKYKTMLDVRNSSASDSGIAYLSSHRITRFGGLMRRLKFDEFPQLFNIFIGQMSFVGPRPDVPLYADRIFSESNRIFDVLPGLTSFASLKYKNEELLLSKCHSPSSFYDEVIWPDKIFLDLCYAGKMSFATDVLLIARTLIGADSYGGRQ